MAKKQYYKCPKCEGLIDRFQFPEGRPCPYCEKSPEEDRADKTYRGTRARLYGDVARQATRGRAARAAKARQAPPAESASAPLIRVAFFVLCLPTLLFYATSALYMMRAEPTFAKAQYVAEHRARFEEIGRKSPIRSGEWKDAGISTLAAKPRGQLDRALKLLSSGRRVCRTVALATGLVGALILSGLYLHTLAITEQRGRANLIGLGTLIAVFVINAGTVQWCSGRGIKAYNLGHAARVDSMLGLLAYTAADERDTPLATQHLGRGAPADFRDHRGATFLHVAAENGLQDLVEQLLLYGLGVNMRDREGMTPLHYAARRGNAFLSTVLMKHGADPKAVDGAGRSALHFAAERMETEMLATLLKYGVDPTAHDSAGETPLSVAARNDNHEAILLLLGNGADVNARDTDGLALLQSMLWNLLNDLVPTAEPVDAKDLAALEALDLLVVHGADVNVTDAENRTPLHWVGTTLNSFPKSSPTTQVLVRLLDMLFDHDADYSLEDDQGNKAYTIDRAVRHGHEGWVRRLARDDPASVSRPDERGKAPFQIAAEEGHLDILKFLMGSGADIYEWNPENGSALHYSVKKGYTDIVRLLLENGFRLGRSRSDGENPLLTASHNGHLDIVRLLLKHNFKVSAKNSGGDTALHLAAREGHAHVVELLAENNGDVNGMGARGETPLHHAAREGHTETVVVLLDYGADIASWNNEGKTALNLARERKQRAVIAILRDARAGS